MPRLYPTRRSIPLAAALVAAAWASPAPADVVRLTNGDALTGTVLSQPADPGGDVVLDHPALGEVTLPGGTVAAVEITPPGEADADAAPTAPQATAESDPAIGSVSPPLADTAGPDAPPDTPAKPGLFGTPVMRGWDKTAEAGLSGTDGNAESLTLYAKLAGQYQDERDRWLLDAAYFYTQQGGATSRSEGRVELTKDWLMPDSPWFVYVRGRYDYDAFQDWRHRGSVFVGPGYEFFKTDRFTLIGRLGVGGTQEFGGPAPDGFRPEGLAGLEGSYKVTDRQFVAASTTLFPILDEFGESRNVTELSYTFKFDQKLSFKLGLENEYESETEGDAEHNDLKYFGAVVYSF